MPSAYLLVSHGSRDPRPQVAMERLVWLLSQSLTSNAQLQTAGMHGYRGAEEQGRVGDKETITNYQLPIQNPKSKTRPQDGVRGRQNLKSLHSPLVGSACLELSALALHQQIAEFADRALELGCDRLQIVPLFLLPGVHVMEDIPAEVALAQQMRQLKLEVRPYLGSHPGLIRLLASQIDRLKTWILLAHGSSRAGAKQPTEAIARQLEILSAYWAIAPSLESRVRESIGRGDRQVGILPYFLFAGGITDAIAQKVKQLQEQFPSVDFHLAQPLGASQELADLILDLVEK